MKTKITFLKLSLVALFLVFSSSAFADDTYYMCTGTTLTLTPPTAPTGTHYTWVIQKNGSAAGSPSSTAPTTLPGEGTYTIILNTVLDAPAAEICPPDPVITTFIVLPSMAFSLVNPTNPVYCQSNNAVNSSVVAQTGAAVPAVAGTDLVLEYSYTVNDGTGAVDGLSVVNGAPLGSINQTTGEYTLTTLKPGTYVIEGKITLKQATTFTNKLLGNGCPVTSTNTKTVTVTPTPAKPVITILGT